MAYKSLGAAHTHVHVALLLSMNNNLIISHYIIGYCGNFYLCFFIVLMRVHTGEIAMIIMPSSYKWLARAILYANETEVILELNLTAILYIPENLYACLHST